MFRCRSRISSAARTPNPTVVTLDAVLVQSRQEKEMEDQNSIKEQVRERYAREAERVRQNSGQASCCGDASSCADPITFNLYRDDEKAGLPQDAVAASLGCGNPTALADLKHGETVLDLGSGGGIDVLLSAKRVGPTGFAYGLDMTD